MGGKAESCAAGFCTLEGERKWFGNFYSVFSFPPHFVFPFLAAAKEEEEEEERDIGHRPCLFSPSEFRWWKTFLSPSSSSFLSFTVLEASRHSLIFISYTKEEKPLFAFGGKQVSTLYSHTKEVKKIKGSCQLTFLRLLRESAVCDLRREFMRKRVWWPPFFSFLHGTAVTLFLR